MIEPLKISEQFRHLVNTVFQIRDEHGAGGVLIIPETIVDWKRLRKIMPEGNIIVGSTRGEILHGAEDSGFKIVRLNLDASSPMFEKLSHAILEAIAADFIPHGGKVVTFYSAFDPSQLDTISVLNLNEHLEHLTRRNLKKLKSTVPLKTLNVVVNLAVEIGQEGREGKSVGTLFVVGDTRRVMANSRPVCFDPVKGYHRKERNLLDPKVQEAIKEISQLDGAILVSNDGTVEATCRFLETSTAGTISISLGLGARHWAAAVTSKVSEAIAIAVSQSSGTVRIYQNGEVALRIESRQRHPLILRDFESLWDEQDPSDAL